MFLLGDSSSPLGVLTASFLPSNSPTHLTHHHFPTLWLEEPLLSSEISVVSFKVTDCQALICLLELAFLHPL